MEETTNLSISDVLLSLGMRDEGEEIRGACPIHGGDNPSAFCFYKGSQVWKCWTQFCDERIGCGPQHLLRALGISGVAVGKRVKPPPHYLQEFPGSYPTRLITRAQLRSSLEDIPSRYYLKRGFPPEILDAFDVGTCKDPRKPLYNRAVVPVYDENMEYVIGYSGRDITNQSSSKWWHSKGYKSSDWLYNIWNAKPVVQTTGTALLVEGPADVWRLEQAGIKGSMAIMGCRLSHNQLMMLSSMGAMNIVVLTDFDEAGRKAAQSIYLATKKLYNVRVPVFALPDDIGSADVQFLIDNVQPILEELA